ncbi:hypothetical protein J6590_027937 [Homalodisca vitripennis]|nr:hypothetical protein J6590_027937 [Homalodisca vitripennis]
MQEVSETREAATLAVGRGLQAMIDDGRAGLGEVMSGRAADHRLVGFKNTTPLDRNKGTSLRFVFSLDIIHLNVEECSVMVPEQIGQLVKSPEHNQRPVSAQMADTAREPPDSATAVPGGCGPRAKTGSYVTSGLIGVTSAGCHVVGGGTRQGTP